MQIVMSRLMDFTPTLCREFSPFGRVTLTLSPWLHPLCCRPLAVDSLKLRVLRLAGVARRPWAKSTREIFGLKIGGLVQGENTGFLRQLCCNQNLLRHYLISQFPEIVLYFPLSTCSLLPGPIRQGHRFLIRSVVFLRPHCQCHSGLAGR